MAPQTTCIVTAPCWPANGHAMALETRGEPGASVEVSVIVVLAPATGIADKGRTAGYFHPYRCRAGHAGIGRLYTSLRRSSRAWRGTRWRLSLRAWMRST